MIKKHILLLLFISVLFSCEENTSAKEENAPSKIESTTLLETTKSWNGNPLPKIDGQPKVTISKVVIPVGAKLPRHIHPVITTGMLTKGELTITDVHNKQTTIKAGDVLVEVSNMIHFGENTGTETAEILVFYIGNENTPITQLAKK